MRIQNTGETLTYPCSLLRDYMFGLASDKDDFDSTTLHVYKVVEVFKGENFNANDNIHLVDDWPDLHDFFLDDDDADDFVVFLTGRNHDTCCAAYEVSSSGCDNDGCGICTDEVTFSSALANDTTQLEAFPVLKIDGECGHQPDWSSLSKKEKNILTSDGNMSQ